MNGGCGLPLELDQAAPLVVRGARSASRGEIRKLSNDLHAALEQGNVNRALVRSDDPIDILRAIDACNRRRCDLWIAHTNIDTEYLKDIEHRFAIQMVISGNDRSQKLSAGLPRENPPSGRINLMTSGTTGRPKIASHTLESLLSRIQGQAGLPVNRGGKWLLTYQPTAFAGLQVILTAVMSHGAIVVPESWTIAGFYEAARRLEVTQISGTPTFWRSFLTVAKPGSIPLRQITLGGEAIDQPTLDRVKAAFPEARLTHIYASTEAGIIFAVHDGLEGFPSQWLDRPLHEVQVRIRDGAIEVKTPHAMQEYVSETAQPITSDGWLRTSDLAEKDGDRVRIRRKDNIINVGGAKVYPQAVESFLLGIEGVTEARVSGVPNPISGFLVGAEVVLTEGLDRDSARKQILARCREGLASYQIPRILKIVDSIQIQASGKKG
jgi:acyl-CoA synthetase (AMP-forming)/AMP-acid ligase II